MFLALALSACLQVPPPATAGDGGEALRAEHRKLIEAESSRMGELAERLANEGRANASTQVRSRIEPPEADGGPLRFVPLAEVVPGPGGGLASRDAAGSDESRTIRRATADSLFDLAKRSAAPGVQHFSLADSCLRGVLARDPDHTEARRLLGFARHDGGWATPHAVQMLKMGRVLDPTFGWVDAAWVPHLARGELPARGRPLRWLPAADADAQRRAWSSGWEIESVAHFEIKTNVPLSEAIAFGRRLEALRELFFSLFADVIGPDHLPLAQRLANPKSKPLTPGRKHQVWFFADKGEYVAFFRDVLHQDESLSLGYYMTPRDARLRKMPARSYFYKDANAQIDANATLFHEASHQVLFESAGTSQFEKNVGNYWVWEGLGTYFETLSLEADGSIRIGGLTGRRIEEARRRIVEQDQFVPLAELVSLNRKRFGDQPEVYLHYAESMAWVVFFMHARGGRYRPAFLDYVEDAYRGRLRARGNAPSLVERLGVPAEQLDREFLAFLGK